MKRETLIATKRTLTGKKVKHLRREGILPANMFGKGIVSVSVQLPLKEFQDVYKKVHETGLVDLDIEKEIHPVLIQNVYIHPISNIPLHASFFKVNLKEKVRTSVPLVAIGEAKAVLDKIGVLLQTLSEVEVEALPADLPENIEVNVENLANVEDSIVIGDIKIPNGVEVITEPTEMIFRIGELVSEDASELAAEEEAAAEAASAETTGQTDQEATKVEETPTQSEVSETKIQDESKE